MLEISWLKGFATVAVVLAGLSASPVARAQSIDIVEVTPTGPVFTGDTINLRVRAVPKNAPANATARLTATAIFESNTSISKNPPDQSLTGGEYVFEFEYDVPTRLRCDPSSCTASISPLSEALKSRLLRLEIGVALREGSKFVAYSPKREIAVTEPAVTDIQPVSQPLHSRQLVRITMADARFTEADIIKVHLTHTEELRRLWSGSIRPDRPIECRTPIPVVGFNGCGWRIISDTVVEFNMQSFAELLDNEDNTDTDHIGLHDLLVTSLKTNSFQRQAARMNAYTFDPPVSDERVDLDRVSLKIGSGETVVALPGLANQYTHDFAADPDVDVSVTADGMYKLTGHRQANLWLLAKDESGGGLLETVPGGGNPLAGVTNTVGETLPKQWKLRLALPRVGGNVEFKLVMTRSDVNDIAEAENNAIASSPPTRVYFGTGTPPPVEEDTITLTNPSPAGGTELEGGLPATFTGTMDYSLRTADNGFVEMRLVDQDANPVITKRQAVAKGSGQVALSTGTVRVPEGATSLFLKAALLDDQDNLLALATGAEYPVRVEETVDVAVERIEVIQVTQDETNSVPLIYDKRAAALVMMRLVSAPADEIRGVEVMLRGFVNGVELPDSPIRPRPSQATITAKQPNRNHPSYSKNIWLPEAWTRHDELTLRAVADPASVLNDPDRSNNEAEATVRFEKTRKFVVKYLKVCIDSPLQATNCPGDGVAGAREYVLKLYPIAGANLEYSPMEVPKILLETALKLPGERAYLMSYLRSMYQVMAAEAGGLIEFDQLVGWVPSHSTTILGQSDPRWFGGEGRTVIVEDRTGTNPSNTSLTVAHELAHNLGLHHPNTPDACGAKDDNTPWTDHYSDATIQHRGWDVVGGAWYLPTNWDFMSYCGTGSHNTWIAPFNYGLLIQSEFLPQPSAISGSRGEPVVQEAAAGGETSGAANRRGARANAVARELVIVSGMVKADGTGAVFNPPYRLQSAAPTEPSNPAGSHCLTFSGGGAADGYCFNLEFQDSETFEALNEQFFSVMTPMPGGTTRIALSRGGQEITALSASSNPPAVTFVSPQPGAQWPGGTSRTLSWSGSDADGDSLTYSALYSHDGGGTWKPLARDTAATEYALDTTAILGGSNVHFRVRASDGFHTATATVGPITLNQAPRIGFATETVDLLNVQVGETREGRITIRNEGTGPLQLNSIAAEGGEFVLEQNPYPLTVPAGAGRAIGVTFAPAAAGLQAGSVRITSNDDSRPEATVRLEGTGVTESGPEIEVSPAALDLGQVAVGGTGTGPVVILNRGPGALTVQSAASDSPTFLVDGLSAQVTLEIGETLTLPVRYRPVAAGQHTGTLTIRSDDPDHPAVQVTLTGSASSGGGGGPVTPAINAGGVVDAASFQTKVSPGGLASIFGDVGIVPAFADDVPLPRQLGGVQVTVNGFSAPLVYVSATQINFQIPFEVQPGNANVVVIRDGVSSPPQTVEVRQFAPGFFTYSGTKTAIAQRPDLSLVTPENPATDGEGLVFYITGLGGLNAPPATGAPASGAPLSTSVVPPVMTVGGANANVFFAGLTPYFIGLGQINAYMPNPLPAATASKGDRKADSAMLPVVIDFNGNKSQVAELPVKATAGPGATDGDVMVAIDSLTPASVRPNETFTVDFRITSAEQLNQEVTWLVYLSEDSHISSLEDQMLKTQKVQHSGVSTAVKTPPVLMPADRSPGTYYAGVIILGGDNDSFGNNISAGLPLTVAGTPVPSSDGEVAVTIRQVVPTSLRAGESFTVDFAITSAAPLEQKVTWLVYLSEDAEVNPIGDEMLKTQKVDYSGTSMDVKTPAIVFPASRPPGRYYVGVVILGGDNDSFGNNMSAGLPVEILAPGGG